MYEPEIDLSNMTPKARAENAERVISEVKPVIKESAVAGAAFWPTQNHITMPPFDTFETIEGYYATLLHELTHWTGHESRNNRDIKNKFGTPKYAFEELIAEIGSSLLLGILGISPQIREDHIGYLQGWLKAAKDDPTTIRRAMKGAQQAVDYLLNASKTLRYLAGMNDNERKSRASADDVVPGVPSVPQGYEKVGETIIPDRVPPVDVPDTPDAGALSSGRIYSDKRYDASDVSDLLPDATRRRLGSLSDDEIMYGNFPTIRDNRGRVMMLSGKFSSGAGPINPRQTQSGRSATPIIRTPDDVDIKSLLGLAIPPSEQQRDITDAGIHAMFGPEKIILAVDAAAGTGKTTTMRMVAMAIRAEFDTQEILDRTVDDNITRAQLLNNKLKYLVAKYPDKTEDLKKLIVADDKDPKKFLKQFKQDAAIEAIAKLGEQFGVTKEQKPYIYYTVFGAENRAESVDKMPDNTGVGTTTQLAYWSLRLGAANSKSANNSVINPDGVPTKVLLSQMSRSFTVKDGKTQIYEAYDPDTRTHGGRQVVWDQKKTPTFKDLGYFQINKGKSFVDFLVNGKKITIPTQKQRVTRGSKGNKKEVDIDVVKLPFTYRTSTSPNAATKDWVSIEEFGDFLAAAFRRWTLSKEMDVTDDVFKLSTRELSDVLGQRHQEKQARGKARRLDSPLPDDIRSTPDGNKFMDTIVGYVKAAAEEFKDGNGMLLPSQDQMQKLWFLTDPDLSTAPGLVGNGSRDSFEKLQSWKVGGKDVGEIIYVRDGQLYKTKDGIADKTGSKAFERLWTAEEGEPYIITKKQSSGVALKKIYGRPDKPLGMFVIDEAQDLNEIWLEIIRRNRDKISIVTVGDDRQQILGFAGSMNIMAGSDPEFSLPLNESYRFSGLLGYLASVILGRQNQDIEAVTGKKLSKEEFKHVVGMADGAARNHINRLVDLFIAGDFAGANSMNDTVRDLYGEDFGRLLNGQEFLQMAKAQQGGRITELKRMRDDAIARISSRLKTRIVDPGEELLLGELPDMVLSRSKAGMLVSAGQKWLDMFVDAAAFLGGRLSSPDALAGKREATREELRDLIKPLSIEDKPTISITKNAHDEAVTFYKHVQWIFVGNQSAPKPPESPLIEGVWSMDALSVATQGTKNVIAASLFNAMYDTDPNTNQTILTRPPQVFLRLLQGGTETLPDGTKISTPPVFVPIRDALDLGKMEVSAEAIADALRLDENGRITVPKAKTKAGGGGPTQKFEIIPPSATKTTDNLSVHAELELDFVDGMGAIDQDDFIITEEVVAGQDKPRIRISSKWSLDGGTEPKFETTAESNESDSIEELKTIAWTRMNNQLIRFAADAAKAKKGGPPTGDPREKKYADAPIRWTGRLIFSGPGADSSRFGKEFADTTKSPLRTSLGRGVYFADMQQVLKLLNLPGMRAQYGVGAKRRAKDAKRDYDGWVIDVGSDMERAAEVINSVGDALRKRARKRSGDVTVQTATTSKGKEGNFVMMLDDFTSPEMDITNDQRNLANSIGSPPPGYMEETQLQYVGTTRAKKRIAIPPRLWAAYFSEKRRQPTVNRLKQARADGHIPQELDPATYEPELDIAVLPPMYKLIDELIERNGGITGVNTIFGDAKDLSNQFEEEKPDLLAAPDDVIRSVGARIGVPDVLVEDFLSRRRDLIEKNGQDPDSQLVRIAAADELRREAAEKILGPELDPKKPYGDDSSATTGDEDDEVDAPVVPDEDQSLDDGEEDQGNESFDESVGQDDDDTDDDGLSSGATQSGFSSGAEDGAEQAAGAAPATTRTSRVRGTPEGRIGRRVRRFENATGQRQELSALELAGVRQNIRTSEADSDRVTRYAMRFWDGFNQAGIALDLPSDDPVTGSDRVKAIGDAIGEVRRAMQKRRTESGGYVVKIGKTTDNSTNDDPSGDTWMLPVETLLETIRIPTSWRKQEDIGRGTIETATEQDAEGIDREVDVARPLTGMYWSRSKPITVGQLGDMLGLNDADTNKLKAKNAGITHDTVRYLIAEIGKTPAFSSWQLFSPVSDEYAEEMGLDYMARLIENTGRANMRDRFIIETFGPDAFPFWDDVSADRIVTPDDFRVMLESGDRERSFRTIGQFTPVREAKDDSPAEVALTFEGMDDTPFSNPGKAGPIDLGASAVDVDLASTDIDIPRFRGAQTKRNEMKLQNLLDYLGIPSDGKWQEELKPRLRAAFGTDDVGLGADAVKSWEKDGVPIAYIAEMIRTGLIPSAREVFLANKAGQRLDEELVAKKTNVYEALIGFAQQANPQGSALLTPGNIGRILDDAQFLATLKPVTERRGSTFSKGKGDVPRTTRGELQQIVDRFNRIFGTNHTIEDIFSHEQLRQAEARHASGQSVYKAREKGKRKVAPNVANADNES